MKDEIDRAIVEEANDLAESLGNSTESWMVAFRLQDYLNTACERERNILARIIERIKAQGTTDER